MILQVPKLEADIGIEVYASRANGIGGRIRSFPEDFVVEEILTDGSKASVEPIGQVAALSGHGRYIICVMVKKGWDTLAAVRKIADFAGVNAERINIAGIKDARALTAQYISVGGVPPKSVVGINAKDLTIGPVRFSSEAISSRVLFGNQFNIRVRSVRYSSATVRRRIERTRSELNDLGGVPNFFGHQRFGTVRPVSHQVGRRLVKENFEDAALLFLSEPSWHEHPEAREARRRLRETQDFRFALKLFPRKLVYERLMLRHLSRYPRDFLGAFRRLPLKLRIFFIQAYQSLLFNRFLSERMNRGIPIGKAEIGDYAVCLNEKGLPQKRFERTEDSNICKINEEIAGDRMAVAIPLIGFDQRFSDGIQGEIEKMILEEEGISPDDFRLGKMGEASARGGLRTVLASVLNLKIEKEFRTDNQNGLSALFSFTLHKGSYATVILREFMKPKDPVEAGF